MPASVCGWACMRQSRVLGTYCVGLDTWWRFSMHISHVHLAAQGGGGGVKPYCLRLSLRQSAIGTYCVGLDILWWRFSMHITFLLGSPRGGGGVKPPKPPPPPVDPPLTCTYTYNVFKINKHFWYPLYKNISFYNCMFYWITDILVVRILTSNQQRLEQNNKSKKKTNRKKKKKWQENKNTFEAISYYSKQYQATEKKKLVYN